SDVCSSDLVETRLAGFLDSVAVEILPHPVADAPRAAVAEVDVGPVLSRGEGEGGDVRSARAVEVERLSDTRRKRSGDDPDGVVAGREVREGVVAVAGGDLGGDHVAAV